MCFCKENIESERMFVSKQFIELYSQRGFLIYNPLELKIDYDPSLFFVNCSICHFKKNYFLVKKTEKYCVSQPALRTNTFREIQANKPLTYTAELEMLGAFSKCDKSNFSKELITHIKAQADFIRLILKKNKVSVDISSSIYKLIDEETIHYLSELNIEMLIKNNPIKWTYGIDNIYGIGTNWNIYSQSQKCEFGNVVVLYKDNKCIGIESGGSIEALIRITNNLPHKIFANTYCTDYIAKVIFGNKPYAIEYYDALNVISNIAYFYYSECPLQLKPILERYIRTIKSYHILYDVSENSFKNDIYNITYYNKYWYQSPSKLYKIVKRYISEIWNIDILFQNRINRRHVSFRGFNLLEIKALKKLIQQEKK